MNRTCTIVALAIALLAPVAARSAVVDATTLPDGTYTVKVVKVMDPKHLEVTMVDTGALTTLTSGRDSVDFSKVQTDDQLKLSLIKGTVVVFQDLTNH